MNGGPSVAVEKPNQDKVPKTEYLLEGLYVLYNTINGGLEWNQIFLNLKLV